MPTGPCRSSRHRAPIRSLDRVPPASSRVWSGPVAALVLAVALIAAADPARAQWLYTTATSIEAVGLLLTPRDVVTDLGSGPLAASPIPDLPETATVAAIHVEGSAVLFIPGIAVELPGPVFATRRDVVRSEAGSFSLELDGAAVGLPVESAIDALARDGSGNLLLSFDRTTALGGLVAADEDLVAFDGASFSLFFDGSAAGVPPGLDLDGADHQAAGDVLRLSFDGAGQIGGIDFAREDLLRFERGSSIWSLELDASLRDPAFAATDLVAVPEPGLGLSLGLGAVGLLLGGGARRTPRVR
ncbi:MAG: hypothetical protein ACX98W_05340 [bacterium]